MTINALNIIGYLMRLLPLLHATLMAVSLSGCGLFYGFTQPNPAISFSYKSDKSSRIGIVQIFELGGKTHIQFKDISASHPVAQTNDSEKIASTIVGQTLVLDSIATDFEVITANGKAHITRFEKPRSLWFFEDTPNNGKEEKTGVKEEQTENKIASYQKEIKALREELAELRSQLDDLVKAEKPVKEPESRTLFYSFNDGKSRFEPDSAFREKLLSHANAADEINVTGYTYSNKTSKYLTQLAKRRASAARNFLVRNGIDPQKIRIAYIAAGQFIADNSTPEGKEKNRRVEIQFIPSI